jgi:hypothetical protein
MAGWIVRRGRAALGAPHPGLRWYLAAVLCLVLALAGRAGDGILPEQRAALRLLHLHLNTLGFVGLTALGTLAVLLPTAAGQPDPDAAGWLRRMLPLAAGRRAAGRRRRGLVAARWPMPAPCCCSCRSRCSARPGCVRFPRAMFRASMAPRPRWRWRWPASCAAVPGRRCMQPAADLAAPMRWPAFLLAFLLPLVSGAASQLLPLWLKPGVQTDWHRAARETLGRFAVLRGLTFVAAGWLVVLDRPAGAWLAAGGLLAFALQAVSVSMRR